MTDSVETPTGAASIGAGVRRAPVRDIVVCPGSASDGNACSGLYYELDGGDGTRYTPAELLGPTAPPGTSNEPRDYGIEWWKRVLLASGFIVPFQYFGDGSIGDVKLFHIRGGLFSDVRPELAIPGFPELDPQYQITGGYGEHSAFFTYNSVQPGFSVINSAGAFGDLYRGRPDAIGPGRATWRGAMTGRVRSNGTPLSGDSLLEYDFSGSTLDLALDHILVSDPDTSYAGSSRFVWEDLRVNADGSFYIPGYENDKENTPLHPTLGYVDGDFYGPNGVEAAGVFERDGVVGAFGAIREE